ncbi:MAG: segregation/condensation protein A [Rhizobiaceae bacterium]|nr:segregation/condensation protein A [Rhizobiaceae bacterium]
MQDGNFEGLWDEAAPGEDRLTLDIDGFEGPLDLLLHLAREQKVDLLQISVLALAEQYLVFVERARALRLDLAADYLVMAAWLAYLKSKLLIPRSGRDQEQPGEELASLLQFRLRRLEAMRAVAQKLVGGRLLGRDVFARGAPEAEITRLDLRFSASLHDLLSAYGAMRQRVASSSMTIRQRRVWALKEARELLERLIGDIADWTELDSFLLRYVVSGEERASALASSFAASLEMVKEGRIEVRQDAAFAPLQVRRTAHQHGGTGQAA